MRKQNEEDGRAVLEEWNSLLCDIDRMCLTDNTNELLIMKDFAIHRIEQIYEVNYRRLTESEEDKEV